MKYHVNVIASADCISRSAVLKRAKKLGYEGSVFTYEQACKICGNSGRFEKIYGYPPDNIYPSTLNSIPFKALSNSFCG